MKTRNISVNSMLGKAEDRYFGEGYRNVLQNLHNIKITNNIDSLPEITAALTLKYPEKWSQKAGQAERAPHLSTLDALLVAMQLTEVILLASTDITHDAISCVWARRVVIRAGAQAVEDLGKVQISGKLADYKHEGTPLLPDIHSFTTRFVIGSLKVELEVVVPHLTIISKNQTRVYNKPDEVLGKSDKRYFGEGFKNDFMTLSDGWLIDNKSIHIPIHRDVSGNYSDISSSYILNPTFVNCILGLAQISQMILYSLDHIDRSISDNLWMRHVELVAQGPYSHAEKDFEAVATVSRTRLIPAKGKTWRVTDFLGKFGSVHARYNLAHALPDRKAEYK